MRAGIDMNGKIAALLRDFAAVQKSKQSMWGYKRAARAILALDEPIESFLQPDGTLRKIPNIGPSSTRVILEVLQTGSSSIVDRAISESGRQRDVETRRVLREHFLSRAQVVAALGNKALRGTTDQTARMINAVNTAGVNILGHPRGRMYGSRPGVAADWDEVFAAAARARVAIEIDGDPARQDIDHSLARGAVRAGCLFAL